ncbi:PREDICTED: LOB domain-containing protein 15 [Prunus mume]|uniref:LOB domain-containing protein 15 n=1 Tax=Prunus mume TaxID=102107 RepID=A0ABM1LQW4_PRUMU|nr:PREDICTED: LOB domain-containing protein 15 [Prunus mume]
MSREREISDEIGKKIKRETDASSHHRMGRRHMLGPPGTLNTITPCAACKLLRRRCAQECSFEVPESQRADAANSLVYEANVRLRDPVYGCMGAISALQQQVQSLQAELNAVRGEILKYKYREANLLPSNSHHMALFSTSGAVSIASLPQTPQPPPPPPPPPPLPPTSSSSSMYTNQPSTADYSTLSSENVSFFG